MRQGSPELPFEHVRILRIVAKKHPARKTRQQSRRTAAREAEADAASSATARRAKEALQRAESVYADVKQQAAQRTARVRQTTIGDLIDGVERSVRRYPKLAMLIAGAIGFYLGRGRRH